MLEHFENHGPTLPHGVKNFILIACTTLFKFLSGHTPSELFEWVFKIMSLLSLGLIIHINFNKARESHQAKKELKRKKNESD